MTAVDFAPNPVLLPVPILVPIAVPIPVDVVAPPSGHGRPHLSKISVLRAVARKSTPHLIEATFVPAALFYFFMAVSGVWMALAAALVWSYGALARRLLSHKGIPPILLLALVGLTARTVAAVASGSTFVYFLLPILGTVAVGLLFLLSLFGNPLIHRLAADFCPLTPEIEARPAVIRLFRRLTMLWAAVNLVNAGATFLLLISLPLAAFVAAKTLTCLIITVTGVVITVSWSVRTAHGEDLLSGGPTGLVLKMRK
jgi:hypothetical protein